MKKITLLLTMIVTTLILSMTTFADTKDLLPLAATSTSCLINVGRIYDKSCADRYNSTSGDYTYPYTVKAGMKTTLCLYTNNNVTSVKWSKGSAKKGLPTENELNFYRNTFINSDFFTPDTVSKVYRNELTLKNDTTIYATVSNGKDIIKITFDVTVEPVDEYDHIVNAINYGYVQNGSNHSFKNEISTDRIYRSSHVIDMHYHTAGAAYTTTNINAKPNETIKLYVTGPANATYKWSKKGKINSYRNENFYDVSENTISIKKAEKITCTISGGKAKSVETFNISIDNNFKASTLTSVSGCKGKTVSIPVTLSGSDLTKVTAKKKSGNGSGFSYKNGKVSFKPSASGNLVFTVKDKYGNEQELSVKITVGDHVCTNWKTTKEPTAIKTGEETGTCSICGTKVKRSIAKLKATINMPTSKKIQVNKKERLSVKLTEGDYILGIAVPKMSINNKKVTVVTATKGKNYVDLKGVREGNVEITVKTKGGAIAKCTVQVVK